MNTAVEPYKASSFDLTHKLTVEKHGHTALITINHPPANTWDRDSLIGLRQLIEHLNRDDDIYALVVTGQGPKFFSAGADLNMFADGDKARAREMARRFGEAFEALRDFRGVSIAAINGYAMGGGLECALACDIRIAERQAQMALPEAAVGLLPCAGGTQALPWLVGEGWAKRMILCNERVDAETALRIGLVEQVVDSGEARGAALLLAAKVARQSPVAIRTIKPLIQGPANARRTPGCRRSASASSICSTPRTPAKGSTPSSRSAIPSGATAEPSHRTRRAAPQPARAESPDMNVLFEERPSLHGFRIGIATLDAEKSLNALSLPMIEALAAKLDAWAEDAGIACVLLRGNGAKAFVPAATCASWWTPAASTPARCRPWRDASSPMNTASTTASTPTRNPSSAGPTAM